MEQFFLNFESRNYSSLLNEFYTLESNKSTGFYELYKLDNKHNKEFILSISDVVFEAAKSDVQVFLCQQFSYESDREFANFNAETTNLDAWCGRMLAVVLWVLKECLSLDDVEYTLKNLFKEKSLLIDYFPYLNESEQQRETLYEKCAVGE